MELKKNQYVLYKGLPLVREGDMLCYGDVDEGYDYDAVQSAVNKIVKGKQAFKSDLYEALDLGREWLEHLLKAEN